MLLLDTESLPPRHRAEAFQSLVSENSSSSMATFEDPSAVHATIHLFEFGHGRVFNVEATGNTLHRTRRMAREANECAIALAVPLRSQNRMSWADEQRLLGPGDLLLVDLAAPYEYGWSGVGDSYAFQVDVDQLAIPMEVVRRAMTKLRESPLHDLVRDHITRMTTEAEQLAHGDAAVHLGDATIELMRALILSCGGDDRDRRGAMVASMTAQIRRYVVDHVRDPGLSPAQIAKANGISVRALYALYAQQDTSLEQSITRLRLDGARRELSSTAARDRPIADVAAAWGFTNASHFSRRFRQAYGASPREWRTTQIGS